MRGLICLFTLLSMLGVLTLNANAARLEEFVGKRRLLIIFIQDFVNPEFEKYIEDFSAKGRVSSLIDRDIAVVSVIQDTAVSIKNEGGIDFQPPSAHDLMRHYKPENPVFTMVLVGKDGEVKERWTEFPGSEAIFKMIDAMPMRQREMQEQNQHKQEQ